MTKVLMELKLTRPLDDPAMKAISKATSIYGIFSVRLDSKMDGLIVDYDGSRLRPEHVRRALANAGIPVG